MIDKQNIERIKEAFTIDQAWHALALAGEPRRSCRVPWREDKRASLALYEDMRRWFDHSQGRGGDVIAFVREATGWSFGDAVNWCAARCGLASDAAAPPVRKLAPCARIPKREAKPEPWPTLRAGTGAEHEELARLRGFSVGAVALAESRGLLAFGVYDAPCAWRGHWRGLPFWAVRDGVRLCELRRLDGLHWPEKHGEPGHRKAHTLGTGKSVPVGIEAAARLPVIAITEGAPDLIAAHEIAIIQGAADRVGVCALLGAGVSRLAPGCLHHFQGKRVRLFPHCDESGLRAVREWAAQIKVAGASAVDAFSLEGIIKQDGTAGKDLADLCRIAPECMAANREFENLFP